MTEIRIQRQVKRLTKQDQQSILWDLALEFRAIIAIYRASMLVQERMRIHDRAKTLQSLLENMLAYAPDGLQDNTFEGLTKLSALVSDFVRTHAHPFEDCRQRSSHD